MTTVFWSYTTLDRDHYLDRFYDDLRQAVIERLPTGDDHTFFRDERDIALGDCWSDELSRAIATAHALVCICSPRYFGRPWCGREFGLFHSRLEAEKEAKGLASKPKLLFPLLWIPAAKGWPPFPPAVTELQWTEGFGDEYQKDGLKAVMMMRPRFYREIVKTTAQRIVTALGEYDLPPLDPIPDLETIPDAFGAADAFGAGGAGDVQHLLHGRDASPGPGPGHVRFIVVAAPEQEINETKPRLRSTTSAYGSRAFDWQPYLPPTGRKVGPLLQGVAVSEEFTSDLMISTGGIVDVVKRAAASNSPVLIVVDPWTLRISLYHEHLRTLDDIDLTTTAVLVPWNEDDPETKKSATDLELALAATLGNKMKDANPKIFRTRIGSPKDLEASVREALIEIRKRIFEHGEVQRKAKADGIFVKPVISAAPR
jgi:FxsC-like protein